MREDKIISVPENSPGNQPMRGVIDLYNQDREAANQQNPNQEINRAPDEDSFSLTIKKPDGGQEILNFTIEVLESPEHPHLPKAYELLAKKFGSEELDPLPILQDQMNGLRYGYEMGTRAVLFAIKDEKGEVVCTLDGGLLPLRNEKGEMEKDSVFMVFYVATEDRFKKSGFGREIMINAYQYAQAEAQRRKLNLLGAAGECTWTSQHYWERLRWRRAYIDNGAGPIEEIPYVQPPLAFDLETGEVEEGAGDAPEHFMVLFADPKAEKDPALKNRLMGIVRAFYASNNYISPEAFSGASPENPEAAQTAHEKHVSAIRPHEQKFQEQLAQGNIRFYSKENLADLRKAGREIIEYVTSDEEREMMEQRAKVAPTQNF